MQHDFSLMVEIQSNSKIHINRLKLDKIVIFMCSSETFVLHCFAEKKKKFLYYYQKNTS